jgi:uncharacterized damage-inducible protein DinB
MADMNPTAVAVSAPQESEYAPFHNTYISLVRNSPDILGTMRQQAEQTKAMFSALSDEQANFRYAPDKWTIKQVFGHMIDTERIFAYRALRIARNDSTPMEGFEQDDYVRYGPHAHSRIADLLEEYSAVRKASVCLFRNLDPEAWDRRGTANSNPVSVRALAYILAGHEAHHHGVLRERYLPALKQAGQV